MDRIAHAGLFKLIFEITGTPIFGDAKKELIIFRIIQESFNNIIKHSAAEKVLLSLKYNSNTLSVSIVDDGKGFDPSKIIDKTKAGLNNISNRVKILNGIVSISSIPNKGTEIHFSIPIQWHE